jgi:hypothetical protein
MFNPEDEIMIGQFLGDDGKLKLKTLDFESLANGIIVAGKSNSGKTNTIESIIYQMILQYEASFMIGDFNGGVAKSITPRLQPIRNTMLQDFAITGDEIIAMIESFQSILQQRLKNEIPSDYPIIMIIDEYISFALNNKPPKSTIKEREGNKVTNRPLPTYFDTISEMLFNCRRVNMAIIIAGQQFTQSSGLDGLRIIKSAFSNKIIHQLPMADAKQFDFDTKMQRVISQLSVGRAHFNDRVVKVPLVSEDLRNAAYTAASQYEPMTTTPAIIQEDTFLADMLDKYGKRTIKIESREDIIRLLKYDAGLSYNQIREYRLPGNNEELHKLYNSV